MFPESTTPGSESGILTHSAQLGKSYTTSPNNAACFAHVPTTLVKSSRADPVNSSEAERFFRFNVPSRILSDVIQEENVLRHELKETKMKLRDL